MTRDSNDQLRRSVARRFARIALAPREEHKFALGPDSAVALGYDADDIGALPPAVTESFCGVGRPLGLGELVVGQAVLDLGSGAGLDCVLAARRVGSAGRVIGVDMTPAMLKKARHNAAMLGLDNVGFLEGRLECLPVQDEAFDVVISNGAFNLCLDKPAVLSEVFRALRPGGRLQMADMLLHDDVTPEEVARKGTWSD
jgi:SAM-dependent methyltransferase